jgi:hypothetical protein
MNYCKLIPALFLALCSFMHSRTAQAQCFRLGGGISTPFDQIVAVRFPAQGSVPAFTYPVSQGQNLGYHISARYMLSTEKGVGFTFSSMIHHFETPIFSVFDPTQSTIPTSVKVSQTLVPFGVGFEYRFLSVLLLHAYIAGEVSYNPLLLRSEYGQASGITAENNLLHRVGANVALGAELTIFGFGADVSLRYYWANILLREQHELSRTFASFTVALLLGEK